MPTVRTLAVLFFTFCFLILSASVRAGEGKAYTPTTDWQAEWITVADLPEPAPSNLWLAFRKTVDVDTVPKTAPVRIGCDSKYWLFINGKIVVREGGLKRGPTPRDTYHDTVDIAEFLKPGKNTIAVKLWYFGKDGFSHKSSGKPGLVFDSPSVKIFSGGTWKGYCLTTLVEKDAQGKPTGDVDRLAPFERITADPQPNYRLPESNIRFDARYAFATDWTGADFDDANWSAVKTLGKPPVGPWNDLYDRPIPQWKDFGLKDYVAVTVEGEEQKFPFTTDGRPVVCKVPYNGQFTPYLKVDAPEGLTVDIRTDNYHGGSEYNVRTEYVTRQGEQEFETPGWMNGHEIIYTMPEGVKVLGLKYRETGYDAEFAGSFECNDVFYNKLWEKSVRTLYVTMRDTYYDCPDRERAQWWGDAVNELGEAFYALDLKSALLAKKGIYELMRWQRDDGVIYSPIPGVYTSELPMQMLASVGPYGFGTYAFYNDDYQPLYENYDRIKKYLDLFEFGDDGLVLHRTGAWDWGDWGDNIDLRVLTNCWYHLAMDMQKEIAAALGRDADVKTAEEKQKRIRANFDRLFWNGKEYRDPAYKKATDDRANAMAVISGLAGPDKYPALREVFQREKHASPYMEKYVLEALYMMRYPDDALARMKERFTKMVEHPFYTTMWEGWGIGAEGFGGGTINHAWSGGGLTCLAQYAVGLEPTSPAFKTFQVMPQMGTLEKISLKTPTKFGDIVVELEQKSDQPGTPLTMRVVVPEGTKATIGLPKAADTAILSAKPAREDEHYWLYDVGPGSHSFARGFKGAPKGP